MRRIDPKKARVVQSGGYSVGSDKLNAVLGEGAAERSRAARSGQDYNESRQLGRFGGSNLGDKTVKVERKPMLLGGSRKQVRKARLNAKRSDASPAAKKAALKIY